MIILDTHALIWWQAGGTRLSDRARREIERSDRLLLSPISFWEIALLVSKGRMRLDRDVSTWTRDLLVEDRVELAPLTATAAVAAGRLPDEGFPGDPADALIYATAREQAVPLVTKDARLRRFAAERKDVRTLW